jgi:hypothetical protein
MFPGRADSLIKALWHDEIGLSLYAKRLDRGRFCLAGDGGWGGGAECGTDESSVGSDGLEKSVTRPATAERGLGFKKNSGVEKGRRKSLIL